MNSPAMNKTALSSVARREFPTRQPAQISKIGTGHPYLRKLIEVITHLRDTGPHGGVFAFTSPAGRVGVTHVVRLVAEELAGGTGERVLIADSSALDGMGSRQAGKPQRGAVEIAQNVWSVVRNGELTETAAADLERIVVDVLSRSFGFILIDCPALTKSADAILIAPQTDGVFLVVAAGETRRDEIHRARTLIREASGNLAGLVLNKRTYPVPSSIFNLFK